MISATNIWARKLKKSKQKKIMTLKKEAIVRNFCSKYFLVLELEIGKFPKRKFCEIDSYYFTSFFFA